MFEKRKKIKQLFALMEQDKIEEFMNTYKYARFKIDAYRPWFSQDKYDLLETALLQNKAPFVDFLLERIKIDEVAGLSPEYNDDGDDETYRVSALYIAIENSMEDLALKLIANPQTDLEAGKDIEKTDYNVSTKMHETYWDPVEDLFSAAARKGNVKIIEALYNRKIEELTAHARHVGKEGFFFRKTRVKNTMEEVAEFKAARDELLKKHTPAPPPALPKKPKPPVP